MKRCLQPSNHGVLPFQACYHRKQRSGTYIRNMLPVLWKKCIALRPWAQAPTEPVQRQTHAYFTEIDTCAFHAHASWHSYAVSHVHTTKRLLPQPSWRLSGPLSVRVVCACCLCVCLRACHAQDQVIVSRIPINRPSEGVWSGAGGAERPTGIGIQVMNEPGKPGVSECTR